MTGTLSVGALAARAGVTVRTLHHYDALGLVRAQRSEAGHRRYGPAEVERLHHVTALRTLGLGLDAIAQALDAPDADARALVARQRAAFDAEAGRLRALADRLAGLDRLLARRAETGVPIGLDPFLTLTRTMNDLQTHYTPDQLRQLADRRDALGEDAIRDVEAEWPRLFEALGAEIDAGTDPAAPAVQALVARWDELVAMFTGGDPGVERSLGTALDADREGASAMMGLDPDRMAALFAYAQRAREAR
ncbi:MerR family transcriptional regulator [Rubrivirga sp. IMCC45206]|uniref:MerR family transcriptional regulator n=1 Tax=Rubrivirga sp. IMCC45206 TaxID=3391614 RepID=UPI00399012D5